MPVAELQRAITSEHFSELLAYDRVRTPDGVKTEYYLAFLCWLIAETNRNSKAKPTPFKLSEFVYKATSKRRRKDKPQTDDDMFAMLEAWVTAFGGSVANGDNSQTERAVDG